MRTKRFNMAPTQVKVGIFTGGVKENEPQLELNIGDLIRGFNYQEIDGSYHGYKSMEGYEVYDGTALSSTVLAPRDETTGVYDDAAREVRRAAITRVGGSGATGSVLGCHDRETDVLASRNNSTNTTGKMWRTTGAGWVEVPVTTIISYTSGNKNAGTKIKIGEIVTGSGASGTVLHINTETGNWDSGSATGFVVIKTVSGTFSSGTLTGTNLGTATFTSAVGTMGKDGKYKFIDGRFDLLADLQRQKTTFFSSSKYFPSYIKSNVIFPLLSHDLPDNLSTGFFATSIIEFKNRLWLGYPDGRLIFSNVGNPSDFDTTTFSGTLYLEDEIVDLKVATGDTLVVFCKNSIQVVKALSVGDTTSQVVVDYLFSNNTLTSDIGAYEGTAQKVFDDITYLDDRGLASLESTQKYGDFETKSFSKYIQRTLLTNTPNVIGASVVKEANQYRLHFSDGFGIIFTFGMRSDKLGTSSSKVIKGATTFKYLTTISCVTTGYFGSTDGFLYKMDSGTSYNGAQIDTVLITSYHHYNSPSTFKRFKEVFFEGLIPYNLSFKIKANMDYKNIEYLPSTVLDELIISGGMAGYYDIGKYDEIKYGSSENQTATYYINGFGTNMSFDLRTADKYVEPHVMSSAIVQYSLNGRKM